MNNTIKNRFDIGLKNINFMATLFIILSYTFVVISTSQKAALYFFISNHVASSSGDEIIAVKTLSTVSEICS